MPPFTLQIFQSELDKIQRYVLDFPNIETGGDLFGLWSRSEDPVVQLIIGPGAKCRRTSVSFHQDIDYLQKVGTSLNTSFMLCHIGSWHSHHQLSLSQPSAGDRSTVCNNFPRGLQRYIMIIANIVTSTRTAVKSVQIHPYMFTSKGHVCDTGAVHRISRSSPYMECGYVLERLNEGAERSRGTSKSEHVSTREVKSPARDRQRRSPPTASLYKTSENIRPTTTTGAQRNGYPPEKRVVSQWYNSSEGKAKLQEINQDIRVKLKPTKDVEFSRNSNSFDLTLNFTHNGNTWSIEFPASFDKEAARIQCGSHSPILSTNIVEAIQKKCICSPCNAAKVNGNTKPQLTDYRVSMSNHDTGKSKRSHASAGSKSARQERERCEIAAKPRSPKVPWYKTEEGKSILETLQKDIESFLSPPYDGKVKLNTNDSSQEVSLAFLHAHSEWIITFPRNYPKEPAKIFKKAAGETKAKLIRNLPKARNFLETLKEACRCSRCVARKSSQSERKTPSARYPPSRHLPIEADDRGKRRMFSAKVTRTSPITLHNPVTNQVKTPEDNRQWYSTDTGEKKLRKICTQISSLLLDGANVDISRAAFSGDIRLEFDYHRCHWRVGFPPNYPTKQPEIGYYDRLGRYTSINFKSMDISLAIRNNCSCSSCSRHARLR